MKNAYIAERGKDNINTHNLPPLNYDSVPCVPDVRNEIQLPEIPDEIEHKSDAELQMEKEAWENLDAESDRVEEDLNKTLQKMFPQAYEKLEENED